MEIKSIKLAKNLKDRRVLVRCDFDIPLKNGKILDDTRLKVCLLTIQYLLKKKAKVILMGHLGRPRGKAVRDLSLIVIKKWLENKNQELKIFPIRQASKNQGIYFIKDLNKLSDGCSLMAGYKICLLENLRFYPEEQKNSQKFARNLSKLGDIYVNEAFAVSHRSAASVDAIQNYLPSFAGLHLEEEIKNLNYILDKPNKPLAVIIGGAKTETKLPVIKQFINTADYILIGGAVANVLFRAQAYEVGKSLVDDKYIKNAKSILKKQKIFQFDGSATNKRQINFKSQISKLKSCQLFLPVDVVVTGGKNKILNEIKPDEKILDIGRQTRILFSAIIKTAKTLVWNGPLGNFENKKFAVGTTAVARAVLNNKKAKLIVGGGETTQFINQYLSAGSHKNLFISVGGGAMLEYLGGKKLPGLKKLIK